MVRWWTSGREQAAREDNYPYNSFVSSAACARMVRRSARSRLSDGREQRGLALRLDDLMGRMLSRPTFHRFPNRCPVRDHPRCKNPAAVPLHDKHVFDMHVLAARRVGTAKTGRDGSRMRIDEPRKSYYRLEVGGIPGFLGFPLPLGAI